MSAARCCARAAMRRASLAGSRAPGTLLSGILLTKSRMACVTRPWSAMTAGSWEDEEDMERAQANGNAPSLGPAGEIRLSPSAALGLNAGT